MPQPPLTYVFLPHEMIKRGFVRVLKAISARGRGLARRSGEGTDESIHEARLLIKRSRALLGLVRPALAPSAYARARTRLRKAAAVLAEVRDLSVTQSTLEQLTRKATKTRDRAAIALTFRSLARNPVTGAAQKKSSHRMLRRAVEMLCQSIDDITRSVADDAAWPAPSYRVRKAFRATRKAGKKARCTGKDADFHTWRKKAKTLFYQLELTQSKPGRRMARIIKCVGKLQEKLGAYHDCLVVEDRLRHLLPLPPAERRVAHLLEKRKLRLRNHARKITRQLDALN